MARPGSLTDWVMVSRPGSGSSAPTLEPDGRPEERDSAGPVTGEEEEEEEDGLEMRMGRLRLRAEASFNVDSLLSTKADIDEDSMRRLARTNNKIVRKKTVKRRSQSAGLKGLMNRLSRGSIPSEEEVSPVLNASIKESPDGILITKWKEEEIISDELKDKIVLALKNNMLTQVENLNSGSLEKYLSLVRDHYPLEAEDYSQLEVAARSAVRSGPTVQLASLKANLPRLKRRHVKCLAFFKENSSLTIESRVQEVTDGEVEFDLAAVQSLLTPGNSRATMRIEIHKMKEGKTRPIGYAEISLEDITETFTTRMLKLSEFDSKKFLDGKFKNQELPGYLTLKVRKEVGQPHANSLVPSLLSDLLVQRAADLFDVDLSGRGVTEAVRWGVSVTKTSLESTRGMRGWWRLGRQPGSSEENGDVEEEKREEDGIEMLACILTDNLVFGIKSVTPPPPTKRKTSAPSPTFSKPNLLKPPSLNNLLRPPSLNNLFFNSNNEGVSIYPVWEVVDGQPAVVDAVGGIEWEVKPRLFTQKKLEPAELKLLYTKGILKGNDYRWDGALRGPVLTILKLLIMFTNTTADETVEVAIAKAVIRAHSRMHFDDAILMTYLKSLSNAAWDPGDQDVNLYISFAVRTIETMRATSDNAAVKTTLENLFALCGGQDECLNKQVSQALASQVKEAFNIWRAEIDCDQQSRIKVQNLSTSYDNFARMTRVLNEFVYPDVRINALNYMEMFANFLNYREFAAKAFVELSVPHIQAAVRAGEEVSKKIQPEEFKYEENSPEVLLFLEAYNTFSALRRVAEFAGGEEQELCFTLFHSYFQMWIMIAMKKAEYQVLRLMHHARQTEAESQKKGELIRQISDDPITEQLVNFIGITESCWLFWHQLGWPSIEKKLEAGLLLLTGLYRLEENFLLEKEKIYLADLRFDAEELAKSVRLLVGLKDRYVKTVAEIGSLHKEVIEKSQTSELFEDPNMEKIKVCYETLEKMKSMLDDEVDHKFNQYIRFKLTEIQRYVRDKNRNGIISEDRTDDSLLDFIDKENKLLYKFLVQRDHQHHSGEQYCRRAITMLWNAMESELWEHFLNKKSRNLVKNKPDRFRYLAEAIDEVMASKRVLVDRGLSDQLDFNRLEIMKEELNFLTASSQTLIKMYLRRKEEEEEEEEEVEDKTDSATTTDHIQISYKLGYIQDSNCVMLEVTSIRNLRPREGKEALHLVFSPTLFPAASLSLRDGGSIFGDGGGRDREFVTKETSMIFDYDGERLAWMFNLNHISSSYKEFEDCFLCLDLFDKSLLQKYYLGDAVFQVVKNGIRTPELAEFHTKDDFSREFGTQTRQLKMERAVLHSKEFRELQARKDDLAKNFVKRQGLHAKRDSLY